MNLGDNLENIRLQVGVSLNADSRCLTRRNMSTTKKSYTLLVSAVVLSLVVGAAIGYYFEATQVSSLMNQNEMMHQQMQSGPEAIQLTPSSGPMPPHDVWFIIAPLGSGDYAIVLSAQGLEENGTYLLEGVTKGGQMNNIPIAGNVADSEFASGMQGDGLYWHTLMSDPRATYEQVILLYLPGMKMQNAQQVASANLG